MMKGVRFVLVAFDLWRILLVGLFMWLLGLNLSTFNISIVLSVYSGLS